MHESCDMKDKKGQVLQAEYPLVCQYLSKIQAKI